jgi:hypothetical protein
MLKTVFSKVMWVGRAASTMFGLALVLVLMFGVATAAFGDNGDFFKLGKSNTASKVSKLIKNGAGPALDLQVDSGAPLKVNSDQTVTNLSADKLDGQDSSDLAEPRGYAHVKPEGDVDTVYPSKGVNDVVIPEGQTSVYCFDLTFTPKTAVGSPHVNNSAVVATVTPPNAALSACPATYQDAMVKTYGSSTGTDVPINFQIVFE